MGQGDVKQKYSPTHNRSFCAVTRQYYADIMMRTCPHDGVQKKYGKGAKVSVYVCQKCRFGVKHPLCAGWSCGYENRTN